MYMHMYYFSAFLGEILGYIPLNMLVRTSLFFGFNCKFPAGFINPSARKQSLHLVIYYWNSYWHIQTTWSLCLLREVSWHQLLKATGVVCKQNFTLCWWKLQCWRLGDVFKMSGCIPWITGNVLADSSPGCYCSLFKGKYCRDIKQWGYLCIGKLEEKAVNSPGLAGSSSAAVHCRAMTTHTSWPFVLVSVGMGCFSEGGACTYVHSWLKFICEVHEIPSPPRPTQ